jgi:hypothetical protein
MDLEKDRGGNEGSILSCGRMGNRLGRSWKKILSKELRRGACFPSCSAHPRPFLSLRRKVADKIFLRIRSLSHTDAKRYVQIRGFYNTHGQLRGHSRLTHEHAVYISFHKLSIYNLLKI